MTSPHPLRLESIDLNLLPVLDALLEERNVTRAGQRLFLSQPATSNALRRLRRMFNDPLLVRSGNTMHITPRAQELRSAIAPILASLGTALGQNDDFDPATASGVFRIATTDHVMMLIGPALQKKLCAEAPGVQLDFRSLGVLDGPGALRDNQVDLLIGRYERLSEGLRLVPFFVDQTVCVARAGHPAFAGIPPDSELPLEQYLAYDHLRVAPVARDPGAVARSLARIGRSRRVTFVVDQYMAAPFILATSDLLASFSRGAAERFSPLLGLTWRALPIHVPTAEFDLVWLPRSDSSSLHQWIRACVLELRNLCEPGVADSEHKT